MTEFINSLVASSVTTFIMHPFDVIRTQYQLNILNMRSNPITLLKNVLKNQGIFGLYKGTTSHLLTYPIFWAIFFQIKKGSIEFTNHQILNNISNSLLASTLASTIANPLFVLKIRKQSEILRGCPNINYINLIKMISKNEGISGFFKGLKITVFGNIKLGLQFPMYDFFLEKTNQNILISSSFSKLIVSSLFYPLDIIRTHQRDATYQLPAKVIAQKILRTNGIKGFYRGLIYHNLTSAPNFILLMLIKDYLENKNYC